MARFGLPYSDKTDSNAAVLYRRTERSEIVT
jgi:hypothetical protein